MVFLLLVISLMVSATVLRDMSSYAQELEKAY